MKAIFYSTKNFETTYLQEANNNNFDINWCTQPLSLQTTILAKGYDVACISSNDDAAAPIIKALKSIGVHYIVIRDAGYDNVDIQAANEIGITVANVPEFSPNAIAEHVVALILALNRKLIASNEQVHNHNFTIDNLIGFDLHKKIVGLIGTGRIGTIVAKIMQGFGCTVMANDLVENRELINKYGVYYVGLHTLCSLADIIVVNVPLTKATKHLIDKKLIQNMKKGVMLINAARGAIVKTEDVLLGLKSGHIGYYGADVYENERNLFFYDHSQNEVADPMLAQLMKMKNVLLTPHQAFATKEALTNIATITFQNINNWANGKAAENEITLAQPEPFILG